MVFGRDTIPNFATSARQRVANIQVHQKQKRATRARLNSTGPL
jgi:hypothetical protein